MLSSSRWLVYLTIPVSFNLYLHSGKLYLRLWQIQQKMIFLWHKALKRVISNLNAGILEGDWCPAVWRDSSKSQSGKVTPPTWCNQPRQWFDVLCIRQNYLTIAVRQRSLKCMNTLLYCKKLKASPSYGVVFLMAVIKLEVNSTEVLICHLPSTGTRYMLKRDML